MISKTELKQNRKTTSKADNFIYCLQRTISESKILHANQNPCQIQNNGDVVKVTQSQNVDKFAKGSTGYRRSRKMTRR